jgi:hypothetical protein
MKPETFKEIQAQREENAQWLRCKVEPILQGVSRPAAMAVFEVGVDMDGVDITQWAFFAQADGAAQARPVRASTTPRASPRPSLDPTARVRRPAPSSIACATSSHRCKRSSEPASSRR